MKMLDNNRAEKVNLHCPKPSQARPSQTTALQLCTFDRPAEATFLRLIPPGTVSVSTQKTFFNTVICLVTVAVVVQS